MKTVHCPIDTSVNFTQAKKLIREINPGCIAIPGTESSDFTAYVCKHEWWQEENCLQIPFW